MSIRLHRQALERAAAIILAAGCVAAPLAQVAAAADSAYDELNARGPQLLKNASFEETNREGDAPLDWGVARKVQDALRLVVDAKASKHGSNFVRLDTDEPAGLWGGLKGVPKGKCRASAWARGSGTLKFRVGVRRQNWRNLPKGKHLLAHKASEEFTVNSTEWTRFEWDFEFPDSYEKDGRTETGGAATFNLLMRGDLAVDRCLVAPVSALPKEAPAAKPAVEAPEPRADGPQMDMRPSVTVPELAQAPTIDGRLEQAEWAGAAAVTGFTQLNSRQWSKRQAAVFVGFDERKLYIAFRCPHEGRIDTEPPVRDSRGTPQSQGIEIWLKPPDSEWSQFLGRPGGAIVDLNKGEHFAWNGAWEFKDQVQDVPEEIGGILTFRKKLWTAEIAIEFQELGRTTPGDGEAWLVNFTRDYGVPKGKQRGREDWTSWSPIRKSFKETADFGTATFRAAAPGVQLLEVGDLANGDLSVRGRLSGGGDAVRVDAKAVLAETGKTLAFKSIEVAPGKGGPFEITDTLKVNETTALVYELTAQEAASGRVLALSRLPFTAVAALRVRAIPAFSSKILYLHADATRVAGLPAEVVVEASLLSDGKPTGLAAADRWNGGKRSGDLQMPISDLKPGKYQAKVFLKSAPGAEPLVASVASFVVPQPPAWLGNKLGVTQGVPAPWKPVKVDGARLQVTQRTCLLGALGLPAQATALGQDLLAAPARLRTVLSGREVSWQAAALELLQSKDRQAVWRVSAKAEGLELAGTLTVEFDGFALWDVTLTAREPAVVDSLALEFPFAKRRSLYARGRDATLQDRGAFAAILNGSGAPEDVLVAGGHFCGNGWIWPEQWCHEVWVGDDERGLSVMCETQENLKGAKRTEVLDAGSANVLRIHLIDGPHKLAGSRRFTYCWQVTPVKPRPADPAIWHATYTRHALIKALEETGERNRVYVTLDMWALKYESYPACKFSRKALMKRNKRFFDDGTKLVPYSGTNLITTDAPDLAPFHPEWEANPTRLGGNPCGGWTVCCPRSACIRDFKVDTLRKTIDKLGFSGLYLDVSSASACKNRYHGCGWQDPETGAWRRTVPILANRRLYQRMYVVNKARGRDAVLFRHGMPVAAIAGYVDVVTQGEDWCREGVNQYDRMTPDIFRAREARIQYGTPFTWYTFHHYYRGERHGGRIPLSAILAYCLPHRVLPTVGHSGIWPVWDVTDRFWTDAEFLPYSSPESPVRTEEADVLGTVFVKRKAKEALLVVANWNVEPRAVEVAVDLEKIGLTPGKTKISRALQHPMLQPQDAPETDRMPNTPLAISPEGRIKLDLHGRNLEVILLRE